jgi:transcriptional regulator with XRE-family HTH domain
MMIGELLANWRYMRKLNVRDAAAVIGISTSSFSRIERGYTPDGEMMYKLIVWLFGPGPKLEEVWNDKEKKTNVE